MCTISSSPDVDGTETATTNERRMRKGLGRQGAWPFESVAIVDRALAVAQDLIVVDLVQQRLCFDRVQHCATTPTHRASAR